MQSKASTAQATKMGNNLTGAEDVHHQEPLAVCPSAFPVRKADWKNMESICTNPVIQKPHEENLNSLTVSVCLCCPRTAWLWLWPGVTFLPYHHFACRALVCEMPLHVEQSSLTYISSPKNNTPSTKGCVIEHLNTLKSALKSCGKCKNIFFSFWCYFCVCVCVCEKTLHLYGWLLATFKVITSTFLPLVDHRVPKLSLFILADVMVRLGTDLQAASNFYCFLNQKQLKHEKTLDKRQLCSV